MAHFTLKTIAICNFRSIHKQTFELKDGLFVILGDNKDNPGVNNGAGKTSLISAFFWAVTGCSLNGEEAKDDVINLKYGKDCKVKCTFDVDGNEVIIQRTRKDTELDNSLYFEVNGQDMSCHKITDTQARIDAYMKIPTDLLKSIIIMTSDMKSRFSDLTNQGRIELLESIRDYSIWNKIREESNKDIKDFDTQINDINSVVNQSIGSINTYKNLVTDLRNKYVELKNASTSEDLSKQIQEIDQQLGEIKKLEETLVFDNTKLVGLETKLSDLQEMLLNMSKLKQDEINQVSEGFDIKKENLSVDLNKCVLEVSDVNKKMFSTDADKKSYQNDINIINKWFTDDTCPTCHRKLDRTEEEIQEKTNQKVDLEGKIQEKDQEIDSFKQTLQELQEKIDEYKKLIENIGTEKNLETSKVESKYLEQENEYKKQTLQLSDEIKQERQAESDINNSKLEYSNQKIKLESSKSALEIQIKENAKKLDETLAQGTEYSKKIEDLEKDLEQKQVELVKIQKLKEMANFFYLQLGPKGALRPYLLARDIVFLNSCIKTYVHKFFEDVDVYLTVPTQENKDIKIIVQSTNGMIKPVSALSGGERKRVDLCIQFALYDLVQSTATFNINFVCFDEIESALDGAGIRSLIDLVEETE